MTIRKVVPTPPPAEVVAEVCLYGAPHVGYGYLASAGSELELKSKLFGDGEPRLHRTLTDCLFLAAADLAEAGLRRGGLRVYAPGGERAAVVDLSDVPYYGDLKWGPAPYYEIPAEAILAAAEKEVEVA